MGKVKDLTGQRFGRLTVIDRVEDFISKNGHHRAKWKCQCDCGNTCEVVGTNLTTEKTKSCGCYQLEKLREKIFDDLTDKRFGRLTVIQRGENWYRKNGVPEVCWDCICDCGKTVTVRTTNLKSGNTTSCGCYSSECLSKRCLNDLTGQTFGKLTVLKRDKSKDYNTTMWECRCECGQHTIVSSEHLVGCHTKSCGCLRSGGEYNITQWLEKNNIEYESQKKFPNLVGINGGNLSYDFYLPTYNILIEAQGQQHITPKKLFGGEEQFQKQKEHDKRKREYAEVNGYKLLEIWYYDYDRIEEILNKELEVV